MAFQRRRLTVLFLLLVLTLLAVWFAPKSPNTVQPIDRAIGTKRGSLPTSRGDAAMTLPQTILAIEPRAFRSKGDMFLSAIGVAPPAPISSRKLPLRQPPQPPISITAAVSPSLPSPSPLPGSTSLPFKVLGYVVLKGETTVLVQHLNQNLAVKTNDTILEQYKVESITANQMTLRNLTLNQVQVVPIQSTP